MCLIKNPREVTRKVMVQNLNFLKIYLEEFKMIKTYKIISLLLSYPSADLMEFLQEAEKELRNEGLLSSEKLEEVGLFIMHFRKTDLTDWQAEYVQLFDNSRSASLHLFEHVKNDSRDRGQAMVDMLEFYKENGLYLSANELPDYLPVFLEFLSSQSVEKASKLLAEPVNVIARIHAALEEKKNMYRHILWALISLSAKQPDVKVTKAIINNEKPLNLDAEYEEKPVEFGADNICKNCK